MEKDYRYLLTQKILHLHGINAGDKFDTKKEKIVHSWWDRYIRYKKDDDNRYDLVEYIKNLVIELSQQAMDDEILDLKDKLYEAIIVLKQTYRKDTKIKSRLDTELLKLKKLTRPED